MRDLRFAQPDLEPRYFEVEKAIAWERRWGHEFPYRPAQHVYVLLSDWEILWVEGPRRWRMHVPSGWVTDLSSVPRMIRWVVDSGSMGWAAPLAHDVIYQHKGQPPPGWVYNRRDVEWGLSRRVFSRSWADGAFRAIQRADRRREWVAMASWIGVRLNVLASRGWREAL